MDVIGAMRLQDFWKGRRDARNPLRRWLAIARVAQWSHPADVRRTLPTADPLKLDSGVTVTVFNIAGNKYRLVTRIVYPSGQVYVLFVLTHAEYCKERWKS